MFRLHAFQSTFPVWGTTIAGLRFQDLDGVSIHVPRVGNDQRARLSLSTQKVSIHVPRVGNDTIGLHSYFAECWFQSTFPVWGTTISPEFYKFWAEVSIHVPRVGNDHRGVWSNAWRWGFNPRSPCGERLDRRLPKQDSQSFQSTFPVWGTTVSWSCCVVSTSVSIHVPRVGNDCDPWRRWWKTWCFNPRSPCGERHHRGGDRGDRVAFQSTFPVWGTTCEEHDMIFESWVSIHVPRVGNDYSSSIVAALARCFNPRSPCGERRVGLCRKIVMSEVSIHVPRVGNDFDDPETRAGDYCFNPRSPCGERLVLANVVNRNDVFQSTFPVWGTTLSAVTPTSTEQFQSTFPVWGTTI